MPLFFFISGWVQKNKEVKGIKNWKEYIVKKVCTLLVPYMLYALIFTQGSNLQNLKNICYGSIFSLRYAKSTGVMWFLPCMFISTIIYQITINIKEKIKSKKIIQYCVLIILVAIYGGISAYFNYYRSPKIGFPLQLNVALSGVVFMFIGNLMKNIYINIKERKIFENKVFTFALSIVFLAVVSYTYKLNFQAFTFEKYNFGIVMGEAWYGNYFMFLINATIASIGIILLSVVIDNKFLAYFGKNTIIILYFHFFADKLTRTYLTNFLPQGTYRYFVTSILVFLEMGLIIPIINKYFANLSGKYIKNEV